MKEEDVDLLCLCPLRKPAVPCDAGGRGVGDSKNEKDERDVQTKEAHSCWATTLEDSGQQDMTLLGESKQVSWAAAVAESNAGAGDEARDGRHALDTVVGGRYGTVVGGGNEGGGAGRRG